MWTEYAIKAIIIAVVFTRCFAISPLKTPPPTLPAPHNMCVSYAHSPHHLSAKVSFPAHPRLLRTQKMISWKLEQMCIW